MRDILRLLGERGIAGHTAAWRLTFTYTGDAVQTAPLRRVEVVIPPSDPTPGHPVPAGFRYDVQDADGRALCRRVVDNPIGSAPEVRTDDPQHPLARQTVSQPRGRFVLWMPDLLRAHTLVLFGSPLELEARAEPAREIARLDLRNRRRDNADRSIER